MKKRSVYLVEIVQQKGETCKASIYAYQSIKLKLKKLLRHGTR